MTGDGDVPSGRRRPSRATNTNSQKHGPRCRAAVDREREVALRETIRDAAVVGAEHDEPGERPALVRVRECIREHEPTAPAGLTRAAGAVRGVEHLERSFEIERARSD